MLLIDIDSIAELVVVVLASTVAMLIFAALTMNWFRIRSRWWENLLLAVAVALLFRPDFFMDTLTPEYRSVPAKQIFDIARDAPDNARMIVVIKGTTIEGEDVRKTVALRLGAKVGRRPQASRRRRTHRRSARREPADRRREVRLGRAQGRTSSRDSTSM